MKISSVRSDIIVVGGGLAGICASITAAREGHTVSLIEKNNFLGGRTGMLSHRFPLNVKSGRSWVYSRYSGILDELWHQLFKFNSEGTYIGQYRVLQDWIDKEKRIRFFRETELESVSTERGRIHRCFCQRS